MKAKKIIGWIFSLILLVTILNECTMATPEIDSNLLKQRFNGSILIAKEGTIILRKGYGMADFKKNLPNTPSTTFRIGSITKQFTAMSILILEEKGKLSTDDPISRYINDYPNGDKITIHNLLTHTSGITEYPGDFDKHNKSPKKLVSFYKNKPYYIPGERFQYCNTNYILLGYIIEKVSGLKYRDFVQQYIFTPLDMKNSGYEDRKSRFENKAVGYESITPSPTKAADYDMSIPYSAGSLCSTVDDLYKWDQALYTEKLIKTETLKKMFTPFSQAIDYGYGWFIAYDYMYHSGSLPDFCSLIYRDTKKHLVVIILCNERGQNLWNYLDTRKL